MKRILILTHHYVPDVEATGQLLSELCEFLAGDYQITVLCSIPSYNGYIPPEYNKIKIYNERINGVNVVRIPVIKYDKTKKISRIVNISVYCFSQLIKLLSLRGFDFIISVSQPPIMGGIIGIYAKMINRCENMYIIQDLNPEQIIATGYSRNKILLTILKKIDMKSIRRSSVVVTVGEDILQRIKQRFDDTSKINIVKINNWVDEKIIVPLDDSNDIIKVIKSRYGLKDKFIIMYSGNLGLYYDLERVFRIIKDLGTNIVTNTGKKVAFVFVGGGVLYSKLKTYSHNNQMSNVFFLPYQEKSELVYSLNVADVHLCMNMKGIKGISSPSKFYGIIAAGKPILGILEKNTEIRNLIEKAKCGITVDPEDDMGIKKSLMWFINNDDSNRIIDMGNNSRNLSITELSRTIALEKYKKIIDQYLE